MRLLISTFIFAFSILSVYSEIKNAKVSRIIDITTPVTRIATVINANIENGEYHYIIEPERKSKLSHIEAYLKSSKKALSVKRLTDSVQGLKFAIKFPSGTSGKTEFVVHTVFTNLLVPKPSELHQGDTQFMKYSGNLLFYSPYSTSEQTTSIKPPEGEILSYTQDKGVEKRAREINYGPHSDKPPHSYIPLKAHVQHNKPFIVVDSLQRHIEVSQWGNIAVEDTIDMHHDGAKLIGSFSRYDMRRGKGLNTALQAFVMLLPATAKHIYYRDDIGNISTSVVIPRHDSIQLQLLPRFPLFGGWKTKYIIGYNVPAHEYLYRKGNQFGLRMRLMDHIYDNQRVRDMSVKIVLPETSSNIKLEVPYVVQSESREVLKTYLDTTGRPVVVVKASNLVEEHIQDFVLYYQFSMINMLREPLMVIIAFMVVFAVAMVYVRLDFTIQKDAAEEAKMRTQMIVEQVQDITDQCFSTYQCFDDALSKYRALKDPERLTAAQKTFEVDHKALMSQLDSLKSKLSECWSEGFEKLNEFQSLDSRYRDLLRKGKELVLRLVDEKISRNDFQAQTEDLPGKKQDLRQKMNNLIDSL